MKNGLLIIFLSLITFNQVTAQEVLERYVDSALANNVVLQQKNIALDQAEYALKISKGMFYPSLDFNAEYTSAEGGRDAEVPLDMLNDAFSSLNQITESNMFPMLENERINFLPNNFYDIKVRASVPILNTDMIYNKKIKRQQMRLSEEEADIYKRELVKDVKSAYYKYMKASEAKEIYRSTLDLAKEGKRVNQKKLDNGKGLPAYVIRAESEVEKVKSELISVEQDTDDAKRYFNFLLNRDQEKEIETVGAIVDFENEVVKNIHDQIDISSREELDALDQMIDLQKNVYKMKKKVFYPSLNGFLDLGSQAEDWEFDSRSRYYMVGLQLEIPLFAGNQNRNKIKKAELDVKDAKLDKEYRTEQLKLSGNTTKNKLKSTYHNYLSAKKRLESVESYHRLINRGYKEGANSYIETVDARNQLTEAQIALSISRYDMLTAQAKLERETASYDIDEN